MAKKKPEKRELTPMQALFVQEYLIDLNATEAAKRAGYSHRTAGAQGPRLLTLPQIAEAVEKAMRARGARLEITQDKVLLELARVAFACGADVAAVRTRVIEPGEIDPLTQTEAKTRRSYQIVELTDTDSLSPDKKAAISGIKEGRNGIEVSMHDKVRALELLGKHLGLFDGKGAKTEGRENNLLDAIKDAPEVDTDDLDEVE